MDRVYDAFVRAGFPAARARGREFVIRGRDTELCGDFYGAALGF